MTENVKASKLTRELIVRDFLGRYQDAAHLLLVEYKGITAGQADEIRDELRKDDIRMTVLRNSAAAIAFKQLGFEELTKYLEGPTAAIHGGDDPVALAKAVTEWTSKKKGMLLTLKAGMVDGLALDADQVKKLADMPSREELLAQLAGVLQAPLRGIGVGLNQAITKIGYALNALKDKNEV